MTLEFARSLPVAPGSNVRGEQADTSWLFLLPTLELGDVVVIGSAPNGTLKALAPLSSRLTVSRPTPLMRRRIRALGPDAVEIEPPPPGGTPAGAAGLIYVGAGSLPRVCGDPATCRRLATTIEAGGAVYLAPGGRRARRAAAALTGRLGVETCVVVGTPRGTAAGAGVPGDPVAWVVPAQAVAAVPVPPIVRLTLGFAVRRARRVLRRASADSARVSEPDRSLGVERIAGIEELGGGGRGLLLRSAGDGEPDTTPAYLLAAAGAARFPLSGHGWRLAPPRGYRSQKVIFFVGGSGEPTVVKLTQDPAFNVLLDNEADALEAFGESALEDGPAIPELHFRARHAGLTLVAESALDGRPFVQGASPAEWDEDAAAVATAITTLGRQTSHPAGADVGDALGEIVGQFAALYRPPAGEHAALVSAASALAELGPALPLVFMHGDATVFNVLVGAEGRIGLVDWENAERSGMPLWDLFHFLQAHAAWQAESSGARYTPRTFVDQVVGPAATRHTEVTDAYCAAVEVPTGAVGSLRRLWLARHAVREARQLPPARLGDGLYHRMLSAWLKHPG